MVKLTQTLAAPIDGTFTTETMGYLMPRDSAWKHFVDTWLENEMKRPGYGLDWFIGIGASLYKKPAP